MISSHARTLRLLLLGTSLISFACLHQPVLANPFLDQAIRAYHAGKYVEAVGLLGEAQSTEFNNPELHYYMANALSKLNQPKDAIKEYKMALAIEPEGQIATYCHAALVALGAESVPGKGTPTATAQPQIIAILSGSNECRRLEGILSDIQRRYPRRVKIVRVMENSTQPASQQLILQYGHGCPTIAFVDRRGRVLKNFGAKATEIQMWDSARALVATASDIADPSPFADNISREADTRIADNQKQLDDALRRVREDEQRQISDLSHGPGRFNNYLYRSEMESIHTAAQKRIQLLNDEFDRKKRQITESAQQRMNVNSRPSENNASRNSDDEEEDTGNRRERRRQRRSESFR